LPQEDYLPDKSQIVELTAHVVAAYVEKHPVAPATLPELIVGISEALANLGHAAEPTAPELVPPVNPKRTVRPDYIISLEDGKQYKSLKRHLSVRGLTPQEYRQKWGLPADYPMVAQSYAAARSNLAKKMGLGRKPKPAPKRGRGKGA
jgi:predicted transcriptional regulator